MLRWHIAAHAGQQRDHGNLAHVRRLAPHVGPRDDLHAGLEPHDRVVGDEGRPGCFGQPGFDNRVASAPNVYTGFDHEFGSMPVERDRSFGECAQGIQSGQGRGDFGQGPDMGLQAVQQLLVEPFLAGQGPLLSAQCLVFKGLELGRDEAFGVFQGLTPPVVGRYFVELALRHLDEKTVHLVVLHSQIGNAGACPFTGFQID